MILMTVDGVVVWPEWLEPEHEEEGFDECDCEEPEIDLPFKLEGLEIDLGKETE